MPDIWTHLIFGRQMIDGAADQFWVRAAESQENIFSFGCQGPDFLFYHRFLPWQRRSCASFGQRLHSYACGQVLKRGVLYVRSLPDEERSAAGVYILGMITHQILDRHLHPYIYAKSREGSLLRNTHKKFEAELDALLVKERWGREVRRENVWDILDLGPQLPGFLLKLWKELSSVSCSDLRCGELPDFSEAYRDMKLFLDLLAVPSPGIRFLAAAAAILTLGRVRLDYYFYPGHVSRRSEILNDNHLPWEHPFQEGVFSRDSVDDLTRQAVSEGIRVLNTVTGYWSGDRSEEDVTRALPDISYTTGMPCGDMVNLDFSPEGEL